jgi:hypothetical protein
LKTKPIIDVWKTFDRGGGLDTISELFKKVGEKISNASMYEINKEDLPAKKWDGVLEKTEYMLKYKFKAKEANKARAQALYGKEKRYSLEAVRCWENVFKEDSKDQTTVAAMERIKKTKEPYVGAFRKYHMAVLKKNYGAWRALTHKECLRTMEANIKSNIRKGVKDHRNLKDYFMKVIVKDPIKEKSKTGPDVIAFDEIDSRAAVIYYAYPSWSNCNRVVGERKGRSVTFKCETGSEMKNPNKM